MVKVKNNYNKNKDKNNVYVPKDKAKANTLKRSWTPERSKSFSDMS